MCVQFRDRRDDEAAVLGWTTLELFGVHPEAGMTRPYFCGAKVLSAERVSEIDGACLWFGNMTVYQDKPGRPSGAVALRMSER